MAEGAPTVADGAPTVADGGAHSGRGGVRSGRGGASGEGAPAMARGAPEWPRGARNGRGAPAVAEGAPAVVEGPTPVSLLKQPPNVHHHHLDLGRVALNLCRKSSASVCTRGSTYSGKWYKGEGHVGKESSRERRNVRRK